VAFALLYQFINVLRIERPISLPQRVVVVSFRFRPNPNDIHGGQDAFVHDLVRELRHRGTQVDVITFRGRDDAAEAIVDGARVHLLETRFSDQLTAHEAHQRGTWKLLEVMDAYATAVERFLPILRARRGGPLLLLNHDIAEARWVRSARLSGDRIITFAHVLFSEFALADLDLAEFERMHQTAHFPLPVRAIGRLILGRTDARQHLERAAKILRSTELFRLLPGPARAALEGERSAFVDAHHVLFPAETIRQKVAATYPRDDAARALRVAPWGVELSPVAPEEVGRVAQSLGIDDHDRVLVTMSRISPDKQLDVLVRALAKVEAIAPQLADRTVAVICGRPTFFEDRVFLRALEAEAAKLRRVRVRFAGYQRGPSRTAHLELAAHNGGRFVQVGRYEAFGLGIAEALSLGIPAITSDTDGAREILDPSRCPAAPEAAAVVRPRAHESTEDALARTIVAELEKEPSDRAEIAARRVGARFNWSSTLEALADSMVAIAPELVATAPAALPRRASSATRRS
jgi:glycosyltransferase involved in cell wall biosynthesis